MGTKRLDPFRRLVDAYSDSSMKTHTVVVVVAVEAYDAAKENRPWHLDCAVDA